MASAIFQMKASCVAMATCCDYSMEATGVIGTLKESDKPHQFFCKFESINLMNRVIVRLGGNLTCSISCQLASLTHGFMVYKILFWNSLSNEAKQPKRKNIFAFQVQIVKISPYYESIMTAFISFS